MTAAPHISVLLPEVLQAFEGRGIRIFLDATLGAGGHSEAILEAHPEIEMLIGFDQDPVAMEIARHRLEKWSHKITLIPLNFEDIAPALASLGVTAVDGILFDLGVSSMQLDRAEKGFSFMRNGPLDMRMNPEGDLTASEVVNTWSENELGRIFREYGEEKQWRAAARVIVTARGKNRIETTHELADIVRPLFNWRKKGVNPLTLLFQALRICVNRELEVLENVLPKAIELLAPAGRLGVISFHSLEDRIAKSLLRLAASDKHSTSGWGGVFLDKIPTVKIITKKPLGPSEMEVKQNPRSRSAKLRVAEKL